MSMSQRSIAVSTMRRPYDSTPFRSHARSYYDERRDIERFCQDGQLDLFDYDDVEF